VRKSRHHPQLSAFTLALTSALAAIVHTQANADQTISSPTASQINWTTGNVTITNSGVISTSTTAVSVGGSVGTLSNSGTLSAGVGYAGISNFGEHITQIDNIGSIGGGDYGVSNVNGTIGTLINSGTINGINGVFNYNGTITSLNNSGLITGSAAAIYNRSSGTIGTLTNSGVIAGSVLNTSSHNLTINGGTGATFGTLTGISGGIGSGNIGTLTNTAANLFFGTGNQLLNDNVNVGATYTITNTAATLQINNTINFTGNYSQGAAATLNIGVGDSATSAGTITDTGYAHLLVSGSATIASGSSVALTKLNSYVFAQGQRFVVIQAASSGTNYNAGSLNYTASGFNGTVTGTSVVSGGYTDLLLTLTAAQSNPVNPATTSNSVAALSGLFNYPGINPDLLNLYNASAALGSTSAANRAGAQLSPASNSAAATQAGMAPTQDVLNVTAAHIDGLRGEPAQGGSGISTGERATNLTVWSQVFGGQANQAQRNDVSGYHATYNGMLLGADTMISDRWLVGGLFSYSNTSVNDTDDNSGSSTHLNSYGLIGYAGYSAKTWYLDVSAGAVQHQYNTTRLIDFTGFTGDATGQHNGMQYVASVQGGYPIKLDALMPDSTLTPMAGLTYSRLQQDGYTESGGSGAALNVDATHSTSLKSDLGAKLKRAFVTSYGDFEPSVQLSWRHEFQNTREQSVANYAADITGVTSFTTLGPTPVADTGVLALAATLKRSENLTLSARYTLEAASGYAAQTVDLRLRYQF